MKEDKTNIGREGRDERDGITQVRIAWPEKVALALQPFGTEKPGQWFTHAAIRRRLHERGYGDIPASLNLVLQGLIKSGHVERALKPDHIGGQYRPRKEYIYRRTGKAFKAKTLGQGFRNGTKAEDIQRGFQLRLDYPGLPKWFRDMMQ